ncbi:hypothetical protein K0B03_04530 [Patescibacteria group bacterium]|nr:hypothetical protein [Patescibacteria group bacterium]
MIITENVVGFMLINIVIYGLLLFICNKIENENRDLIILTIFFLMGGIFLTDFLMGGTFLNDFLWDEKHTILGHIYSWLNQFSALELFFIFFFPLIISAPIFYLFSKPSYLNHTRFTIRLRLKEIKLNKIRRKLQKIETNIQKRQNNIIKDEYKRNKLNEKKIKKAKALESKIEDKKNKLKMKETEKTKALESKIEDLLFNFASKNNGIIMKSEIFDITKTYQKRDVLSTIEKLKEESLIELQDNAYRFPNLI